MSAGFREKIRLFELECVLSHMRPRGRVLELGAGTGWQARKLDSLGFSVCAIDLPPHGLAETRIWPVREYDGKTIPYPDGHFDVVFSSNVLEHIPHVESFQREIHRVLKPEGIAIHILPTATWRLWTSIGHYFFLLKLLLAKISNVTVSDASVVSASHASGMPVRHVLRKTLLASRHGETGNALTELYYFSRVRWLRLFRRTGWTVSRYYPAGLYYSGYLVLDALLGITARRRLACLLGSSCLVYLLRKNGADSAQF